MRALDHTIARFGLRVVIPAIAVLVGAIGAVVVSMREMAEEVNRIELTASERSVVAAVQSTIRRLGETNGDYANWDDAVRNLYGEVSQGFADENLGASSANPVFFDAAFLVDAAGRDFYGVHLGEPVTDPASVVYGPSLAKMIGELPKDVRKYEVRAGIVASKWGLAVLSVGPVTPVAPDFAPVPSEARYLILSKAFDDAMLTRLSEDFLIDGLRTIDVAAESPRAVEISDPTGARIAALTWSPRALGTQAQSEVSPIVLVMLALVSLIMIVLLVIALRSMREVEAREVQARHAATHDSLTGLPNRTAAIATTDKALAAMREGGPSVSLVYIDLTGFKAVNDAYGHETGDRVLIEVAASFRRIVGTDLARVGGDEYVAIVRAPDSAEAARDVAWQFIALLAAPFDIDGRIILVGASVGIATAEYDGPSAEELMRRADVAMYQAKQQGRNRIFVYDPLIDTVRHERLELSHDLRRALKRDELTLAYQPVFGARNRTVTGVEALVRWARPNFGEVPPSVFIPVAEEAGLIDELGIWALRRACRDALQWPSIRVSVNVSPAQLRNPSFDTTIRAILRETGLPADRLELEVTESYFMANPDQARRAIDAVRNLGVSVALDDFGTGYSSIGYLKAFTFDKLKLDRSMITGIGTELRVQRLVHAATIALADALDLTVTAEGVETEPEASLLSIAGCSELQGFYLARPGPAAVVTKLLAADAAASVVAARA